jgi:glycosyltransferase involved in cell wall biosynthesis
MSKLPVSVYIICQNEAQHIRRVLESVKDFDEVIIVDSGSTDETLTIAKEYTDKIYHQEWLGFAGQKEYAKNLCSNKWVLNLDADEQITSELKGEIEETMKENSVDGLDIKISSKYLGRFNHPLSKFNRRVRFFRKSEGHYPSKLVHESIVIEGKVKNAKGFIYDFGTPNLETHVDKINKYSSLRAQEKAEKRKKASILKLLTIFPLAFFKSYMIKRGFLNGNRGFISAMTNAYYAFLKEAKLYETNREEKV